ncbi:hypothetical protein FB382_002403 [Nocardioides ginsengisegetis]|uniref:Putative Flp pilus-assembly TadG-like N-terminal domain-containing protein n=1 Tax=Nocardioides ginsengisegetis TaxID=661491 RepID=A0A7W3J0P7_9ACTN|nr:hypothetical protein [Nocardioides ginsengisegetis]
MFTAIVAVVLLVIAAFTVDLGNTWARRGQLQVQADRAATYAAQFLPADTDAQRVKVAKAVAYYVACHPVPGQAELNPGIPACPADPTSATLDSYAAGLLAAHMVEIPVRNQVKVLTPRAQIDFGFAGVVGKDGTIQQKQATAKVTSPGLLAPMALSLDCLLNAGGNLLNGGVPFGYISTTHQNAGPVPVTTTWPTTTLVDPKMNGVSPGRVTQQLSGTTPNVQVSGKEWPALSANQKYVVAFARGSGLQRQQYEAAGTLTLNPGNNPRRLGYLVVAVPPGVMLTAGEWQVKVAVVTTTVLGVETGRGYSIDTSFLNVDPLLDSLNDVSCGRLLKSPREGTQASINFILNLQNGIDHLITQYPTLLSTGALSFDALKTLVNATQCDASSPSTVKDTNGNNGGQVPNCVVTNMSNAYEAGFTEGMIGAQGRLTCTSTHPCAAGRTFSLNGRSINDDRFTDFVINPSLLTSQTFFNTDTYLSSGLPVITPTSNLKRGIYDSSRFMWVAVISTAGATSAVQAGDYPVLTFRPIFITQASALDGTLPLLDQAVLSPLSGGLLTATSLIDQSFTNPLQPYSEPDVALKHGLLMDSSGKLRAIRFMTISPSALPAVPADYHGAESEYVGVGPRIIRLVQ